MLRGKQRAEKYVRKTAVWRSSTDARTGEVRKRRRKVNRRVKYMRGHRGFVSVNDGVAAAADIARLVKWWREDRALMYGEVTEAPAGMAPMGAVELLSLLTLDRGVLDDDAGFHFADCVCRADWSCSKELRAGDSEVHQAFAAAEAVASTVPGARSDAPSFADRLVSGDPETRERLASLYRF
ncbi:hypothetical protein [Homoserinibacter sp. YIM 151385]|uniref:hypothetical protein n=1 Tax=Homoserinibacter sp. YIM 151385 TaxID=2985506 RepID=UPI0022EFFCFD|nr:hypothetical protein [Homoserinibacter sp. YIM 151385]WBU38534.1 hypothetical protein OF852_02810 [Homoserinibacter sp. YIM 151385]